MRWLNYRLTIPLTDVQSAPLSFEQFVPCAAGGTGETIEWTGVLTLVFLLVHLVPGDPVDVMLGESASTVDREALQQALDDLPHELRMILLMYYFEDLSYQEIAEELRLAAGTVMSRLSRAKERLRQRLGTRFPKSSLRRSAAATAQSSAAKERSTYTPRL